MFLRIYACYQYNIIIHGLFICILLGNLYGSRQEFLSDLQQIEINSIKYNGSAEQSVFTKKATELLNIANEFLELFNEQLSIFENNIEKSKSKIFDEYSSFGDQSQDAEGYDSDEDDEDMEVVEAPVSYAII